MNIGQRGAFAVLTVVLFVVGALLGTPGNFPVLEDGSIFSPEFITQLLAPLGLLVGIVWTTFQNINQRVVEGVISPGDLLDLLKLKEFWTAILGVIVLVVGMFTDVEILTEEEQINIANGIALVITTLLGSWATRRGTSDPVG